MQLFHTSPNEITEINPFGLFGECLCFSADIYQMSACSVLTYTVEIEDNEMIEASSFFYRDDYEKLNSIVIDVMELAECDEEQAQEYLSQLDSHSDAEIDWRLQGYTGEAAKALGYKAAIAEDEQGAVYIVPMLNRESELSLINE